MSQAQSFLREFLTSKSCQRYIFGHNQYSQSIITEVTKYGISIDGILDDFTTQEYYLFDSMLANEKSTNKIPILKSKQLYSYITENTKQSLTETKPRSIQCKVVVVVVTSQTKKALQKICALQGQSSLSNQISIELEYIDYFAFVRGVRELLSKDASFTQRFHDLEILELEFFDEFAQALENKDSNTNKRVSNWADFRRHFNTHTQAYQDIYEQLADRESKRQFENILNFRLNSDWSFMRDFEFSPQEQYFEDFCCLERVITFFDIGAYHGETSLEFIKRASNYQDIYFFEPERNNFIIAKQALHAESLKADKCIRGFNIGVTDKAQDYYITADSTSSHLQTSNSTYTPITQPICNIQTNSLDNLLHSQSITLTGGGGDYD